jgi:hypothetical protein
MRHSPMHDLSPPPRKCSETAQKTPGRNAPGGGYSHGIWWINHPALYKPTWGRFVAILQSREAFTSQSEPPSECFCGHLHRRPPDMTLRPHQACVALKRKPLARGTRAPRLPSIVDGFCRPPWLGYAGDSVAPDGCPLVLAAAQALPAAMHADGQNGSTLATTPGGPTSVATAVP